MIELKLYSINDGDNVINKTLTNPTIVNIHLKQGFDIIKPEIVLNGDFRGFNYAHIPNLNRYYFIDSVEQLNLKLVKLVMTCDVIETYKADIMQSNARYNRAIKNGDYIETTLDRSVIKTIAKHESDTTVFSNDRTIILTTLGA